MERMSFVLLLLLGSAAAQVDQGMTVPQVRVQIDFLDTVCEPSTHVTLMGGSGPVAEGTANDRCVVAFANVPAGRYHLSVSGQGFTDTNVGIINASSAGPSDFEIRVKHRSDLDNTNNLPVSSFVSAADLGIPARAHKEFQKANELFARQNFTKAIQELDKAIAIYPAYAVAYNNLGVIYSRLGDSARSRNALEKAIGIDDHLAPAYVNLGRINIRAGDFPEAETMLTKASALDPTNAIIFTLLAYSELMTGRRDQAIANSRRAHASQGPHAVVHQVAARALKEKGQRDEAIAELELFLKEEPSGHRAEDARKELADLRASQLARTNANVNRN
jgi:tetratricopeptide (TPR) repeat protein